MAECDLNITGNCSFDEDLQCDSYGDCEDNLASIYPDHYEWALISAHFVVFIIGLVGNVLVCVAVWRNTSMRTVTNYFIVNLAVGDFLVILLCLPPTVIWDVTSTWFLGEALCKIVLYFQTVSVSVSVLTLTVISVERWYAICYPLKFKATTSRAKRLILLIWTISLVVDIPELIFLETIPPNIPGFNLSSGNLSDDLSSILHTSCAPDWPMEVDLAYIILRVLILYAIPLIFMCVAYYQIVRVLWRTDNIPGERRETLVLQQQQHSHDNHSHNNHNHLHLQQQLHGNGVAHHHVNGQNNAQLLTPVIRGVSVYHSSQAEYQLKSRRKAAKMLVAVVIMFAMCYLPVHIYSVFVTYNFFAEIEVNHDYLTFFAMISHWLCYANSAINPLIYNFMSGKFRREFARAFQCLCSKNEYSPATSRVYTYNLHLRGHNHHHHNNHHLRQNTVRQVNGINTGANGANNASGRVWC